MITRRILLLAALVACSGGPSGPPSLHLGDDATTYWPDASWRSARPVDVDVDQTRIDALLGRLQRGELGAVDALVIARKGYVIVDTTFGGWSRDSIHTMQSVTKSVTSLATGIAIGRGLIRLDEPMTELLGSYTPFANDDARKRAITVRDLLTMRTGLDWVENPYAGSPLERLNTSQSDWLRLVVDWPMRDAPGTRWEYNSGGVVALGGAIGVAAGMNAADFVRQNLLRPIGVTDDKWARGFPDLLPHMGGGLFMTTRDLARVGYLVLRNGKWKDAQIVPRDWIATSTSFAATPSFNLDGRRFDYGYLWWILPLDGETGRTRAANDVAITASGALGQWLFVVPRYDLVVAINSNIETGNYPGGVEIMLDHVLPAMR
jgi:CubicO group peptidase (beta-lactamase class C family)